MDFAKILVPVSGSKADVEVVRLACKLAKGVKGTVYVVYVIEVKRTLPLDVEIEPEIKKGEIVLDNIERCAEAEDFGVETELLQAREVGPAIVEEAVEREVDVILMGVDYKRRFGEFTLGDTLPYVLKYAPCRILVWREPIPLEGP